MANLIFTIRNQIFMIVVKGKEIYYNDKRIGVQMLYPNPSPVTIRMSGRPSPEELREYNMCQTEDELISFVVRDCTKKGAILIRRDEK